MMGGRVMRKLIVLAVIAIIFSACASGGLTTREKATLGGGALGAGAGAIIGSATGQAGTGALIGGGIGALTGAILGDQLQAAQQPKAEPGEPAPATAQPTAGPPPSPRPAMAVPSPQPVPTGPIQGEVLNATLWEVKVNFLGHSGTLAPGAKLAALLDIGEHKLQAEALSREGQVVGRADKTFKVEPSGWAVRLQEADFPKPPPLPSVQEEPKMEKGEAPVPEPQKLEKGEGPVAIQLAEALATPVLAQEIGKLKIKAADVQVLKDGQVEVTLMIPTRGRKT